MRTRFLAASGVATLALLLASGDDAVAGKLSYGQAQRAISGAAARHLDRPTATAIAERAAGSGLSQGSQAYVEQRVKLRNKVLRGVSWAMVPACMVGAAYGAAHALVYARDLLRAELIMIGGSAAGSVAVLNGGFFNSGREAFGMGSRRAARYQQAYAVGQKLLEGSALSAPERERIAQATEALQGFAARAETR